jgi:hypothetical protein
VDKREENNNNNNKGTFPTPPPLPLHSVPPMLLKAFGTSISRSIGEGLIFLFSGTTFIQVFL